MDSRAVLQPVGPRPPYVYWVRRLVLLAVVTVVVVLAAHACSGGGRPDASLRQRANQQPLTDASGRPTSSASPTPARPLPACRPQHLAVQVSADRSSYPSGTEPRFTAVVRNSGSDCRFPTALASRTWRIVSGSYQVWSTADCQRSTAGKRVTLKAGAQITYVLPWDRFGSVPGCAAAGPRAQPGTYRLYVTIAGATGPAAIFVLAR